MTVFFHFQQTLSPAISPRSPTLGHVWTPLTLLPPALSPGTCSLCLRPQVAVLPLVAISSPHLCESVRPRPRTPAAAVAVCLTLSSKGGIVLGSPQNICCSGLDHCPKFRFLRKRWRESGSRTHLSELCVSGQQCRNHCLQDRGSLCGHQSFPPPQAVDVHGLSRPLPLD